MKDEGGVGDLGTAHCVASLIHLLSVSELAGARSAAHMHRLQQRDQILILTSCSSGHLRTHTVPNSYLRSRSLLMPVGAFRHASFTDDDGAPHRPHPKALLIRLKEVIPPRTPSFEGLHALRRALAAQNIL